ncbi:MAG: hypothetical protein HND53_00300 [Proteobacteria bacterium]|nr:hypothetical protein [Pseudomonadota bacterium]NOG58915.1 hypothetical protein [Pseudomonadota bacterium]
MRFQTLRAQTNDIRHTLSSGNFSTITHELFKFLTHHEKSGVTHNRKTPVFKVQKGEDEELRSLENCANAARKTEALGQFE